MLLLNALENGDITYHKFRNEWYVSESKKLSVTISKVNLPAFSAHCMQGKANTHLIKVLEFTKDITFAQRERRLLKFMGCHQRRYMHRTFYSLVH